MHALRKASLVFAAVVALGCHAAASEIRVGVLAYQGSERSLEEFEPTRAYLEARLPDTRVALEPLSLDGMARVTRAASAARGAATGSAPVATAPAAPSRTLRRVGLPGFISAIRSPSAAHLGLLGR